MPRDYPYEAAVAGAFAARVAAGEAINDLLDRPGMPSQRAYRHWRRTHAGFQARLAGLRARRYAGHSDHPRWRWFDRAIADRMLVRVAKGEPWRRMLEGDPTMPSRVVVYRWRVERPAWDAALKIAFRAGRLARERDRLRARCAGLSDEIGEQIALGDRQSLRRLADDPRMPSAATLYKWKAMFPDFARTVADAREFRDCMAAERAYAASPFYEDMRRAIAGMIGGG